MRECLWWSAAPKAPFSDALRGFFCFRSSKSAIHGLVHWLASAYAKKGITVNAVAPALIEQTTMLPGATEELKQSKLTTSFIVILCFK